MTDILRGGRLSMHLSNKYIQLLSLFSLITGLALPSPGLAQVRPSPDLVRRVGAAILPIFERALTAEGATLNQASPNRIRSLMELLQDSIAFRTSAERVAVAISEFAPAGEEITDATVRRVLSYRPLMNVLVEHANQMARLTVERLTPSGQRLTGTPRLPGELFRGREPRLAARLLQVFGAGETRLPAAFFRAAPSLAEKTHALEEALTNLLRMNSGRVISDGTSALARFVWAQSRRAFPQWIAEIQAGKASQQRLVAELANWAGTHTAAENALAFPEFSRYLASHHILVVDRATVLARYSTFLESLGAQPTATRVSQWSRTHSPELVAALRSRRGLPGTQPFDDWLSDAINGGRSTRDQLVIHVVEFFRANPEPAVEAVPEFEQFLNQLQRTIDHVPVAELPHMYGRFLDAILSASERRATVMDAFERFLQQRHTSLGALLDGSLPAVRANELFLEFVQYLRTADVVRIYSTVMNSGPTLATVARLIRESQAPTRLDLVRRGVRTAGETIVDTLRRRSIFFQLREAELPFSFQAGSGFRTAEAAWIAHVDRAVTRARPTPFIFGTGGRLPYFANFFRAADACLASRPQPSNGREAVREAYRAVFHGEAPSETVSHFGRDLLWDEGLTLLLTTTGMATAALENIHSTQADQIVCPSVDPLTNRPVPIHTYELCLARKQVLKLMEIGRHVVHQDALGMQEYTQANEYFIQLSNGFLTTAWSDFIGGSNQTINRRFVRTVFTNEAQSLWGFAFYKSIGRISEGLGRPLPQRRLHDDLERLAFELPYGLASGASSTVRYMVLDGMRCLYPNSTIVELGVGSGRFLWRMAHSQAYYIGRQRLAHQ